MKILLSWLREFAPFTATPEQIGHDLGMLGTPVEDVVHLGQGLDGIVVAKVLELTRPPEAKKVQRVLVDAGDGEPVGVWCGAFNMQVGDLVALATIGTVMPSGMEIGRRKIAGEYSNGMLCSTRELELGDDHDGILVLPPDAAPLGTPIREALGIEEDVVWDLEINPNRPDAMSVAGIARDLAAFHKLPFALPTLRHAVSGPAPSATISLDAPDLCGRFTSTVIRGVTVCPSDPLIQRRLTLLGMRPINNVVDVSNYVMLELGQPNHPYDLAKVPGGVLGTRRARDGETLVTLDGVTRTFTGDDLLIVDRDDRPIGIAGVMGGENTEIDDTTTDVLLEMAWFQPISVSKTGRRLGLRTDASSRFEKGCDIEGIDRAVARFVDLLGGMVEGTTDVRGEVPAREAVRLRTSRVNRMLGTDLTPTDVRDQLEPIGFACTPVGDDHDVVIPSWRPDSAVEIDLVEEVARHWGYERIGAAMPDTFHFGELTEAQLERRKVRRAMLGLGYSEAMPMAFLAPGDQSRAGLGDDGITITNPLVAEESVLRTSLLPGLLKSVAYNLSHRLPGVALWEIGHVFRRPAASGAELPDEREHLAAALVGAEAPAAVEHWLALAEHLRLATTLRAATVPGLHPTRSAEIVLGGQVLGAVGEVDPGVLEAFAIHDRVAWFEVDLGRILGRDRTVEPFAPFSRFPSSDVDLAFEVDESVPAADVLAAIRTAGGDLLVAADLFDVYRAAGRRSLAFALRFQAPDRTLTDAEVGQVRRAIIDAVQSTLPATLRG